MVAIVQTKSNSYQTLWVRRLFQILIDGCIFAKVNGIEVGSAIAYRRIFRGNEDKPNIFDVGLVAIDTKNKFRASQAAIDVWQTLTDIYVKSEKVIGESGIKAAEKSVVMTSREYVDSEAPLEDRLARMVFDWENFVPKQRVWAARRLEELAKLEA